MWVFLTSCHQDDSLLYSMLANNCKCGSYRFYQQETVEFTLRWGWEAAEASRLDRRGGGDCGAELARKSMGITLWYEPHTFFLTLLYKLVINRLLIVHIFMWSLLWVPPIHLLSIWENSYGPVVWEASDVHICRSRRKILAELGEWLLPDRGDEPKVRDRRLQSWTYVKV